MRKNSLEKSMLKGRLNQIEKDEKYDNSLITNLVKKNMLRLPVGARMELHNSDNGLDFHFTYVYKDDSRTERVVLVTIYAFEDTADKEFMCKWFNERIVKRDWKAGHYGTYELRQK